MAHSWRTTDLSLRYAPFIASQPNRRVQHSPLLTTPRAGTHTHTHAQGRKYKTAQAKNVRILAEHEFYAMLRGSAPQPTPSPAAAAAAAPTTTSTGAPVRSDASRSGSRSQLWADAHKPQHMGQIIGNKKFVRLLDGWLQGWAAIHLHGGYRRCLPSFLGHRGLCLMGCVAVCGWLCGLCTMQVAQSPGTHRRTPVRKRCCCQDLQALASQPPRRWWQRRTATTSTS